VNDRNSAQRVRHPIFARVYERISVKAEPRMGRHRAAALDGTAGRVLEVGAGNGLNFPYYPREVTEVVAVEPEERLRGLAEEVAAGIERPAISITDAVAENLPFEDGSFDAAVASLVLCSVRDQPRALAELWRVLRAGGELRFHEHVIAEGSISAGLMRAADATFWPRVAGGCHMARDTAAAIERAGFVIQACERFSFAMSPFDPPKPHIVGRAVKPSLDAIHIGTT